MKKQLFLLSVGAVLLAYGEKVDEYQWREAATEGSFNDPANWAKESGAAFDYPQAGCLSFFYNILGNWTVKIPADMGDDASYTLVRNLKGGSRLVFDTTDTGGGGYGVKCVPPRHRGITTRFLCSKVAGIRPCWA